MRISIFLMILGILQAHAIDSYAQKTRLSVDFTNTELITVLDSIENESDFYFLYNEKLLDTKRTVSIKEENQLVSTILEKLFTGTDINYTIIDRKIILAPSYLNDKSQPQEKKITGKVVDKAGDPIVGANVVVTGTTQGAITDINGKYSINLPQDAKSLTFTFIGMQPQEISIGTKVQIDATLVESAIGLEEVIVVGYGTQKKVNLTAAVDQVTNKTLDNRSVPNLTQGLQGVMPNLNITLLDGKPIQAPSYNIRGTTSIGQGGSALILIDGVQGDPSMLNPNDIASVTMLKDAASASIYGARGAFGVVLITTKNPERGKTSVTFSSNYSIKSPVAVPKLVTDGYTWINMFVAAFQNGDGAFPQNANKSLKISQAYIDEFKKRAESGEPYNTVEIDPITGNYIYYGSTDWYKELYKKTVGATDNNITVSGSGEKASYLISSRFLKQDGLFRYNTDNYSMNNFRAKGTIQVFPWLQLENNTDYSQMKYHNPIIVGENEPIWESMGDNTPPPATFFNPDGTLTYASVYSVGDFWYGKNGIDLNNAVFRNKTGLTARFLNDKLRIKGDFTILNTNNNKTRRQVPVPYSNISGVIAYVGTATNDIESDMQNTQYLATNIYAEYENTFLDSHYFKVMVGYNQEQSTYKRLDVKRNGLIFPDVTDISIALGQSISTTGGWDKWAIIGGFSRLNYSYKDRYLLEVNARYDGSSKFPTNQRYAFFPSLSGGWRISKEIFWKVSPKIISDLKIRASYGSLGNGNVNSYAYLNQFSVSQSNIILNGVLPKYTNSPSVLPDGLTWETATTANLGLDITTLSDRLSFTGDYYIRNTINMYTIGLTLPATFGATSPKGNYADLQTKGWELSLSWKNTFNVVAKPFNYNVRFTLANNKSVITRYNNPNKLLSDYYEGQVVGEIWGYTTEGFFIDQADIDSHAKQSPQMRASPTNVWYPGDIKLLDANGDGFINIGTNTVSDPGDRKIIGNRAPRYLYGINLGADWNNLFFSTFFQGVMKQDWYPAPESDIFWGQYNRPYNTPPTFQLGNMWTPENTNAYFPRTMSRAASNTTSRELGVAQTKYLQNIAYLRLKNIQIGYNLPKKLTSIIGANDLKVYFSGENLWCYSPLYKLIGTGHMDVENTGPMDQLVSPGASNGNGANYPILKSFTFGLSITF